MDYKFVLQVTLPGAAERRLFDPYRCEVERETATVCKVTFTDQLEALRFMDDFYDRDDVDYITYPEDPPQ